MVHDDKALHTPVLIAGGGPVGLALAALLARLGVRSRVIEQDGGYCSGSRAICLSRRSLEILGWAGAAEAVQAKGLGWTRGRSHFREREVLAFDMPHAPGDRFAPMTNIQQFYVEEYLHRAMAAWPGMAEVHWATAVEAVDAQPQGVAVQCRTPEGTQRFTADWLVACDGGRSTVREQLGLALEGTTYEGRYVIVDIRQKSVRPTERLAWFDPPSNPGSTVLMHRQPDDVWRIDYQLREDEDPQAAVLPQNVLPRVRAHLEWMGEREPWEPLWISIYNAKCLSLARYRHGRVLFAGDAAHLVPIFGVRGLNSGLDDAGNLAWKLAAAVGGSAADALLDTYDTERRAAALLNIEFGSRSTEFMAPPHRGFALMREAVLRLAAAEPAIRHLINPRQSAPVPYPATRLTGTDEGLPHDQGAPGRVAPEARAWLQGRQRHLTELFGAGWVLLGFGPLPAVEGVQAVALDPHDGRNGEALERYGACPGSAWLVRPDGYVAARWREAPGAAALQACLRRMSYHAHH
ncbi:FAD-dependent monooxygenase [Ramlibacter tataouinensis]|uniref:Pentachlorophenol 4-monooxygenase-like protein n=1 Tax=Ramlibacter tataouinensis (strain ATCC BAA-407 / DSM 14655 / LMG 21543 / TTB310) TaxID=365046 RepID=F5Y3W0_RAMTT|nr:FAD-dependent monooxygenase [Ramlibacter tataouinensis]AEG91238.1 Pentachlorophenol 4-monooxygenase-like protein [Ramlibacter tataouinensis TTB310]